MIRSLLIRVTILISIISTIIVNDCFNEIFAHGKPKHKITSDQEISKSRKIHFPDTENFKTLILDPHTHSSFSDGHVWPRIRVEEALRDGLDALAITEHLEYLPHQSDLPFADRNRAYQAAIESNQDNSLLVIPGVEITRNPPQHHYNALFIQDANRLLLQDQPSDKKLMPLQDVFNEAKIQNAFVILNHAWWDYTTLSRNPSATAFQILNAKQGKLQGMEIANKHSYSAEAFQTAMDLNLTLIAGSDIHGLIDWEFNVAEGGHRTVTLVFAKNNTSDSIHQALIDGRTVVWFKNQLIGLNENLNPLLKASIQVTNAEYRRQQKVLFIDIENNSDAEFQLKNLSEYPLYYHTELVTLPPNSTSTIAVRTHERLSKLKLEFEILNTYITPSEHAHFQMKILQINHVQ